MRKLSLLLPVYNEEENLIPIIEEIEATLRSLRYSFEVITVDDCSTDGSADILRALAKKYSFLKVIFFRKNFGQTAAFDAGFRHACGDIIVTLDSDFQNDPRDIPKMLELLEHGYDFVTGWRRKRRDNFWGRTLPSLIANKVIRWVTKTKLHDLGCSLKAYRKEITHELKLYGEMHRFIGVLVEGLGVRVAEIEVNHRPRNMGRSKYTLGRTFKVLIDLITVWFLQRFQSKPSYVFGGIGIGLGFLGAMMALVVLANKFLLGIWVHKQPLFVLSIFFSIIGIQFIVMGLLAELLIRVYFEGSHQLPYSIKEKIGFGANEPDLAFSNNRNRAA